MQTVRVDPYAPIFEYFIRLLTERLEEGIFTTEDAVRYTMVLALLELGHRHTDITVEEPLVGHNSREVDLVVQGRLERPTAAFEFKYDRQRKAQQNRPQRAGAAYRDIFRLAEVHAQQRRAAYFIYLTDPGMAKYLRGSKHRHHVFSLNPGESAPLGIDFVQGRPPSLVKNLHGFLGACTITCSRSETLPAEHWLHILSVEHTPDAVYRYD